MNRSKVTRRYLPVAVVVVAAIALIVFLPSRGSKKSTSGGGTSVSTAGNSGDIAHCVDGRQFDPAIDYSAPPCAAKWTGTDNGGATAAGVTADSIKVVEYLPQSNPAIDAIAKASGLYVSPAQLATFRSAAETFVNSHYELYGRKIHISAVDGRCNITPPDNACLRNDFRRIVKDEKPYAIVWPYGSCSACFDEMSQLQTVNLGGMYFSDGFAQARAPYHWDAQPSGTLLNASIGQFWCANLAHKAAQYALSGQGTVNGTPRKLGVVAPNDPEVQATVAAAKAELARCGDKLGAEYYYSADLTTAVQQMQAATNAMHTAGVTSVYFLADIAGPGFFMGYEQNNHYSPENVLSGAGTQDNDTSARQLQTNAIACPQGAPCPMSNALGLSTTVYEPLGKDVGARVWHAAGNAGSPPSNFVTQRWDYYSLLATLIQAAGPKLTAAAMDTGVRANGLRGDEKHALRGFPAGSYAWGQDIGMQYWNKDATSAYDGKPGAWVVVGKRSPLGGWVPDGLGQVPKRS